MVIAQTDSGRAFTEVSQVDSRNLHRAPIASRETARQREVLSRAARDLTPCPGSRAFVFRDPGAPYGASGRGNSRLGRLRSRRLDSEAIDLDPERGQERRPGPDGFDQLDRLAVVPGHTGDRRADPVLDD